jgi:multiple sugar transport system substrate-binding protein
VGEVFAMNAKLVKRDARGNIVRMGFIPDYGNLMMSMLIAWECGAEFLSDNDTKVHLNNHASVEGLTWVVKFYDAYPWKDVAAFKAGLGVADQHGFISEKIAMMVLDNTFPDQIKQYRSDLEYGVALIPSFEGKPSASASGSWWLAIPRGAKNTEAAWQFMKYAANKNTQLNEVAHTALSMFPANRYAATDSTFNNSHERSVFVRQMDFAHSPSIVPMAHDVFWREFMGAQERAAYKLQTPEAALKQGETIIQSVLDEAQAYNRYVMKHMNFPGVQ